jgi:hypothetical protein
MPGYSNKKWVIVIVPAPIERRAVGAPFARVASVHEDIASAPKTIPKSKAAGDAAASPATNTKGGGSI